MTKENHAADAGGASARPNDSLVGMAGLRDIDVDGIAVPIGGTFTGDEARALIPTLAESPGLHHLSAIGPGGLSLNAGMAPTRLPAMPTGSRVPRRRRDMWVLLPSGEAWVHASITPATAKTVERLQKVGATGLDSDGRRDFAAKSAIEYRRRLGDLRAQGCIISVVQISHIQTVSRLHSAIALDTPPDEGLPVIEAETVFNRAHPDAAFEQGCHFAARLVRQLDGLVDQAGRYGGGQSLRRRFTSEGLLPSFAAKVA